MKNRITIRYAAILFLSAVCCYQSVGQLNSFGTGYFQNQYVFNPAMSGLEAKKGNIGLGYRKSGNVKDGPNTMYLLGDYAVNEKMGLGVNVFYDKAGLFNNAKVMATYSYHIQLGEASQKLHFGLSIGGIQSRLNNKEIIGDRDDPALYNYNNRRMEFESDFGVAYTDGKLNVQAAAPNMVANFRNNEKNKANKYVFFAAASYKIKVSDDNDGISVEPKVAFRGIRGNTSIFDAGANVTFMNELINVFGLYHTNKSVSAGAGVKILDVAQLTVLYTTQSAAFKTYSGGDFEVGLKFHLK